ncbi:hypothetical protein SKDZ_11G1780 [Saccharomyces kudriavzevii ZP591]|nr:hypothetical protein SKDZ_11G1780 [Saccharomyces kudriavzevii ZP591]
MHRINDRFSIIDGWLIDPKKKALVNPKEVDAPQNFIYKHHLIDWDEVYDEEFNIYCEDDETLFEVVETDEYWFQIDPITGAILKVSRVDLGDFTCLRCHKLSVGSKKTLYIHCHPYEKNTPRTCQMKYMHRDSKQHYYPLCSFKGEKFTEIGGFVIKLNKYIRKPPKLIEQTLFDPLSSNEKEGVLSINDWYALRKFFKGKSLIYLRLINSNFLIVKDITLFHLSFQQTLVKLKKKNDFYTCEKYGGQEAIDHASIHLAIPIICHNDHIKYIVWKQPIFPTQNFDAESVDSQLNLEVRIADRLLNNEIITLEKHFLRDRKFSMTHQMDDQGITDSIASTYTVLSEQIVRRKCGSLLNQIIIQCKIKDTATTLAKRDSTFDQLSNLISNFCFTESMARLQWWQECIRNEFDIPGFDNYHQSCNDMQRNVDKAIEFFLPVLITQHQKTFQRHLVCGPDHPEISKRYLFVDKFIVDVSERRVVNPLSDDIFQITSFRNAKLNISNGILDWSSFIFDSMPYPVFSPTLFTLVETEELELTWDESSQAFVKVDRATNVDTHSIVRRKGIQLDFPSYGKKYLYQGKLEDLERSKLPPDLNNLVSVHGYKDSERLRFMWSEMERIKSLYEQRNLVEESFYYYLEVLNFGSIFNDNE